jgi:hypothetical protein
MGVVEIRNLMSKVMILPTTSPIVQSKACFGVLRNQSGGGWRIGVLPGRIWVSEAECMLEGSLTSGKTARLPNPSVSKFFRPDIQFPVPISIFYGVLIS